MNNNDTNNISNNSNNEKHREEEENVRPTTDAHYNYSPPADGCPVCV